MARNGGSPQDSKKFNELQSILESYKELKEELANFHKNVQQKSALLEAEKETIRKTKKELVEKKHKVEKEIQTIKDKLIEVKDLQGKKEDIASAKKSVKEHINCDDMTAYVDIKKGLEIKINETSTCLGNLDKVIKKNNGKLKDLDQKDIETEIKNDLKHKLKNIILVLENCLNNLFNLFDELSKRCITLDGFMALFVEIHEFEDSCKKIIALDELLKVSFRIDLSYFINSKKALCIKILTLIESNDELDRVICLMNSLDKFQMCMLQICNNHNLSERKKEQRGWKFYFNFFLSFLLKLFSNFNIIRIYHCFDSVNKSNEDQIKYIQNVSIPVYLLLFVFSGLIFGDPFNKREGAHLGVLGSQVMNALKLIIVWEAIIRKYTFSEKFFRIPLIPILTLYYKNNYEVLVNKLGSSIFKRQHESRKSQFAAKILGRV